MRIIGISAFYHDSAACLLVDGKITAAAQEERFSRKKQDSSFPINAISYCLDQGEVNLNEIDYIVFYEKPLLKFERIIETYLAVAPRGFKNFSTSMPIWVTEKLFQKKLIIDMLGSIGGKNTDWESKLLFSEHHLSHAASAFYPSPFKSAAILTLDGVGEWATTSLALGDGNKLSIYKEIKFPHSIGLLYSAMTYFIGFKVNSGEYKVMGLAPYGQPKYVNTIKDNLIDIKPDGSFSLNLTYFNFCTGLTMTNAKFSELFAQLPRQPESELKQIHMDLAASIQAVLDEVILKLAKNISENSGKKKLCLAGGVALNCVSNGKILQSNLFEEIWIQPAAGDAGGALGAALSAYHIALQMPRVVKNNEDSMSGSFLGPEFSDKDAAKRLLNIGAKFNSFTENEVIEKTATALAEGKAVGWMSGRMEFGPRSLGNRSILADPRSPETQKLLNLKIKFRESFRPFAPSVLLEEVEKWFNLETSSPYMLLIADVAHEKRIQLTEIEQNYFASFSGGGGGIEKLNTPRSKIPAVTHVDYSARVQTVDKKISPRYHKLIEKFKDITNCPVLVNTSFNIRGEPIVCTPEDAYSCFMGTNLDMLVIGNLILEKAEQTYLENSDYRFRYDLD
jgi:carbamoyltransferase